MKNWLYRIYNVEIRDEYLEGTLGVQFYIKENVYTQYICHQKIPRGAVIPIITFFLHLLTQLHSHDQRKNYPGLMFG